MINATGKQALKNGGSAVTNCFGETETWGRRAGFSNFGGASRDSKGLKEALWRAPGRKMPDGRRRAIRGNRSL